MFKRSKKHENRRFVDCEGDEDLGMSMKSMRHFKKPKPFLLNSVIEEEENSDADGWDSGSTMSETDDVFIHPIGRRRGVINKGFMEDSEVERASSGSVTPVHRKSNDKHTDLILKEVVGKLDDMIKCYLDNSGTDSSSYQKPIVLRPKYLEEPTTSYNSSSLRRKTKKALGLHHSHSESDLPNLFPTSSPMSKRKTLDVMSSVRKRLSNSNEALKTEKVRESKEFPK